MPYRPQDVAGPGIVIDMDPDGGLDTSVPALAEENALGLTAKVAATTFERDGYKHLIKAAEAVYSYPANGSRLSLPAQKMLNFMIHLAGSQNFANKLYRLPKKVVRGNHKGNERIFDAVKEIYESSLVVIGPFRGRRSRAELRILSSYVRPEEEIESDSADIHFQFTDAFLELQRASKLWARLSGPAMVKVTSTYALKLYEIGMQRYQMDFPSLALDIDTLRRLLNVPEGAYKDFGILRTRTIDRAIAEVNQLAPFRVEMPDAKMVRRGRKVEEVTLDFFAKDEDEVADTFLERERHSVGRRARRTGKVEKLEPAVIEAPPPLPDADDANALWAAARHALLAKNVPAPLLRDLEVERIEETARGERRLVLLAGHPATAQTARMNHEASIRGVLISLTSGTINGVDIKAPPRRKDKGVDPAPMA
ncbi:replication initiation protein [Nitrospirillum pindoramense]|uniref:Replication initiator protein n=1 Tax=Nitrospirillum amazonense TaxID=28077 RepID=A0A560HAY9_9PROT|nr:replication initiation protein [Nitrospirillum amazonense]TWB43505.1 replication initiator protein [Nitrospirillum amazonense]